MSPPGQVAEFASAATDDRAGAGGASPLHPVRIRSPAEARMAVFAFMGGFHHPTRRHAALGRDD